MPCTLSRRWLSFTVSTSASHAAGCESRSKTQSVAATPVMVSQAGGCTAGGGGVGAGAATPLRGRGGGVGGGGGLGRVVRVGGGGVVVVGVVVVRVVVVWPGGAGMKRRPRMP